MTLIPFARLVREMRRMQGEIHLAFHGGSNRELERMANAEKSVDRAVREILGQMTLFGRDDEVMASH